MKPRITFGIIVLNGEPFVRYNLRALYPFAHQIIVVEGAAKAAANVATPEGHSRDMTLATLRRFKAEEDPDDKLIIITRDGFWSEKDEMSQAYAAQATGDYLWQIDIDEFYLPEVMQEVIATLTARPDIGTILFPQITFWGSIDYWTDGWFLRRRASQIHRVFKWGEGYSYKTHRPPIVLTETGQDTRELMYTIDGQEATARGWYMYHYSLLLPRQVREKCDYYSQAEWAKRYGALDWAQNAFLKLNRPFYVHNVYDYPSWLERFAGQHPPQITAMWHDIEHGDLNEPVRQTDDIERLLNSFWYRIGRSFIKHSDRVNLMPRLKYYRRRLRERLSL